MNIPGYIDEPIPIEEDDTVTICDTVTVVDGMPYIEHGGLTPLYSGAPDCKHEIVGGDNYSGIKCRKCKGWYCA